MTTQEKASIIKDNATRTPTRNELLWASWTPSDGQYLANLAAIYGVECCFIPWWRWHR